MSSFLKLPEKRTRRRGITIYYYDIWFPGSSWTPSERDAVPSRERDLCCHAWSLHNSWSAVYWSSVKWRCLALKVQFLLDWSWLFLRFWAQDLPNLSKLDIFQQNISDMTHSTHRNLCPVLAWARCPGTVPVCSAACWPLQVKRLGLRPENSIQNEKICQNNTKWEMNSDEFESKMTNSPEGLAVHFRLRCWDLE